ncbi:MAG: DUF1566 domain-containing protein [Terriglobales bacterium]
MTTTYTKLGAGGAPLGADSTDRHEAVRIEHPLLARPLIVSAYRSPKRLSWKKAAAWAEKLDIYGWQWRLPSAEEGFFIPNRARYPAYDTNFFPDCEGEWIWTSTPDAEDPSGPSGFAWGVGLLSGYSGRLRQGNDSFVRAVCAGQP